MYHLLKADDAATALDVIDLTFRVIDQFVRASPDKFERYTSQSPDDAIAELNVRFRERGVGYQYESGQIVRVDSQVMHAEVVKPALQLLQGDVYRGANQEFLKAHEHYRKGNSEECLNECLKAFESTMKAICAKRGWAYRETDNASRLITTCFDNELIPAFLQSEFAGLRSILESGVPTARNRFGAHGQGMQVRTVESHFAAYVLHMTAANILYLIDSEKALP